MYKNLENLRKSKGYTIKDMGKFISKSPATYYKKETGKVAITVKEAIIISEKLDTAIEILFKEY